MRYVEVVIRPISLVADASRGLTAHSVGALNVESANSLAISIENDGDCRIAIHAAAVGVYDLPSLQIAFATQIGQFHKRVDLIIPQSRIENCHEGQFTAENIPAAEDGARCVVLCRADRSVL